MTRAFGPSLHRVIAKSTSNRFSAFLAGIGVTTILQSSTATALIIASFCGQGLIGVSTGVAIMLGADVGTTLVAQILTFDLSWLAPFLLFTGFVVYRALKGRGRVRYAGLMMIGLGLMLLALGLIKTYAEPLQDSETLQVVLKSLDAEPFLAVLLAAILTWLMHSSLATILLFVSLIASGVLSLEIGLVMVIGANIGGAIAPLVATLKEGAASARVPAANMGMRIVMGLICLPFMSEIQNLIMQFDAQPERLIVHFHTGFNLALFLLFIPFTGAVAKMSEVILPDKVDPDDPSIPKYLDEKDLGTPPIALSDATRETLRIAEYLETMMKDFIVALDKNDSALLKDVVRRDDVIDNLYKAIKYYMAKIMDESLDEEEAQRSIQILNFSTNLEAAGDTMVKSLADIATKKITTKKSFSDEGWQEILTTHNRVLASVSLAQNVFMSGDQNLARQLIESKDEIRLLEEKTSEAHLNRIRDGVPETIATSSIHLDIVRDYRRINSYVATVAYPILEEAGYLRKRRLKRAKK